MKKFEMPTRYTLVVIWNMSFNQSV